MSQINTISFKEMSMSQADEAVQLLQAMIDNKVASNQLGRRLRSNDTVRIAIGDSNVCLMDEDDQSWGFPYEERVIHALVDLGEDGMITEEQVLSEIQEIVSAIIDNDFDTDELSHKEIVILSALLTIHDFEFGDKFENIGKLIALARSEGENSSIDNMLLDEASELLKSPENRGSEEMWSAIVEIMGIVRDSNENESLLLIEYCNDNFMSFDIEDEISVSETREEIKAFLQEGGDMNEGLQWKVKVMTIAWSGTKIYSDESEELTSKKHSKYRGKKTIEAAAMEILSELERRK